MNVPLDAPGAPAKLEFSRFELWARRAALWLGVSRAVLVGFVLCGVLALISVWLPRFPVGVDLPQHANLFRLWTELHDGPLEYRHMYRVAPFTPYLLTYAIAYPLTVAFGAVAATKCLLSIGALATPVMLTRWLKTVGARPAFGLVGYVLAFDYGYLWGFISYTFALPLMFAYFVAVLRQPERPGVRDILRTSVLGILLFFSHGIIFGFSVVVVGLTFLFQGAWLRRWLRAVHVLPMGACALFWFTHKGQIAYWHPTEEWFDKARAITLFSGSFMTTASPFWAYVALAAIASFLLVARPRLAFSAARVVPVVVALVAFVVTPDWILSTWLVGSRCSVFVHAFAPALLVPRTKDWVGRQWPGYLTLLVAAFLALLTVRLLDFNDEIAGCFKLAKSIPAGTDLQTLVTATELDSDVFGQLELGQVPAWITAEQGGMIDNDSGTNLYYQIPIRRREDFPFPSQYRFAIAHGELARFGGIMRAYTGLPNPTRSAGKWRLFEHPPIHTDDYFVVRSGQSFAAPRADASVMGSPLTIAGVTFAHGLGVHARSFVRLRFTRPGSRFEGAVGLDDGANGQGSVRFRISSDRRGTLFDSGVVKSGRAARRFSVDLAGESELLLEVLPEPAIDHGHADWVDLALH
ncbi:MAG TPA: NPCBM/NEW2 domain-containing protein [Polyangiaceae bacterium]|nr:NPCBM/NEW2 domain-containing protein [Polyangiaceae bacterium]